MCPSLSHREPSSLTLISAGVMRRLVGRCFTVAALESASTMSALSAGSAAAKISSSFSENPNVKANGLARAAVLRQLPYDRPIPCSVAKQGANIPVGREVPRPVEHRVEEAAAQSSPPQPAANKDFGGVSGAAHPPQCASRRRPGSAGGPTADSPVYTAVAPRRATLLPQLNPAHPCHPGTPDQPARPLGSDLPAPEAGGPLPAAPRFEEASILTLKEQIFAQIYF